jgi:hypothetical protein
MTDAPYDGFRFEWSRPDVSSPNGVQKMHIIAVARSRAEAERAVAENIAGSLVGARLIGQGQDVLTEAKRRGIADGQASAL